MTGISGADLSGHCLLLLKIYIIDCLSFTDVLFEKDKLPKKTPLHGLKTVPATHPGPFHISGLSPYAKNKSFHPPKLFVRHSSYTVINIS